METLNPTVHLSVQASGKLDLAATLVVPNGGFYASDVVISPFKGISLDLSDALTIQLKITKVENIFSPVQLHTKPLFWEKFDIEINPATKQLFLVFVLEDSTLLASYVVDLDIKESIAPSGTQRFSDLEKFAGEQLREKEGDIRVLKKLKDRPH